MKKAGIGALKGVIGEEEELERRGLSAEEIKAREEGVCSVINNCSCKTLILSKRSWPYNYIFINTED